MTTLETRRHTIETWARAWSEPNERKRLDLLAQAASTECTYIDPNTQLSGHEAISEYMAGFQESAPGARFVTVEFRTHHDRCVVRWNMVDASGTVLSPGVSAGQLGTDGRLVQMVGFFDS